MNEFRVALDAYLAGRTDLQSLENTLRTSLQRQPHLAAAHSAIIEAMFRTQRLPAQARDSLHKVVQSVGRAAAPAPTPAPPPPPRPAPPPLPPAGGDKTQFRVPA